MILCFMIWSSIWIGWPQETIQVIGDFVLKTFFTALKFTIIINSVDSCLNLCYYAYN